LSLAPPQNLFAVEKETGINKKGLYNNGGISRQEIPVKLVYQANKKGAIRLAWELSIYELDYTKAWQLRIDAETGELIKKTSLIKFSNPNNSTFEHNSSERSSSFKEEHSSEMNFENPPSGVIPTTYNVYALPYESPYDGGRTMVTCPEDPVASPEGWTGGITTNVNSHNLLEGRNIKLLQSIDPSDYTFNMSGITSLTYDYEINTTYTEGDPSLEAVSTNAFYWSNIVHDITYHYGFDEAAGNFQEYNFGRGGVENDRISINVNATSNPCGSFIYVTGEDGSGTTMVLMVCDPQHHALDNQIIIHEYVHGISGRLVGGSDEPECLENSEQMGEGWSDWYALMLTMKSTDLGSDIQAIGNWGFNLEANAAGIRDYPYTTDMNLNPLTYSNISTGGEHDRGAVWCSMLWELTWGLIDVYGFDEDFYFGSGGNNIALRLVTEGLKLTICSPGFVNARNAILAADQAIYGGANQCIIWQAFAKRGLGFDAHQGESTDDVTDGTVGFEMPDFCSEPCPINIHHTGNIASGTYKSSGSIVSTGTIGANQNVEYDAARFVCLPPNFLADASNGSVFLSHIEGCVPLRQSNAALQSFSGKIHIENHPNPFSGETIIEYVLEEEMYITTTIKDVNGKTIEVLNQNEYNSKGTHNLNFDGSNLPSGIYYCTIQAGDHIETQKMVITK